jgi:hypothetical protein
MSLYSTILALCRSKSAGRQCPAFAYVLSFVDKLGSPTGNLRLKEVMAVSVRPPDAFVTLFDPESLYVATQGGDYPGPDRDPRE